MASECDDNTLDETQIASECVDNMYKLIDSKPTPGGAISFKYVSQNAANTDIISSMLSPSPLQDSNSRQYLPRVAKREITYPIKQKRLPKRQKTSENRSKLSPRVKRSVSRQMNTASEGEEQASAPSVAAPSNILLDVTGEIQIESCTVPPFVELLGVEGENASTDNVGLINLNSVVAKIHVHRNQEDSTSVEEADLTNSTVALSSTSIRTETIAESVSVEAGLTNLNSILTVEGSSSTTEALLEEPEESISDISPNVVPIKSPINSTEALPEEPKESISDVNPNVVLTNEEANSLTRGPRSPIVIDVVALRRALSEIPNLILKSLGLD